MISPIQTNFGVNPSDISFKCFLDSRILFLNGSFTVDTTNADYLSAGVLRLTFTDIELGNSHEAAVYVLNTKGGAHDITVTKAWFEDGRTLCIMPVLEYEPLGEYTICVLSAFFPKNVAGEVSLQTAVSVTPTINRGALTGYDIQYVRSDRWAMLAMTAASITFDETEEDIVVSLPGLQDLSLDFLPVIYTNSVSYTYGSKFYPASISKGVLTICKDGISGDTGTTFSKFIKAFIALDQTDVPDYSDNE